MAVEIKEGGVISPNSASNSPCVDNNDNSAYPTAAPKSISDYLKATCAPGQAVELRVLTGGGALSGVFDDYEALASKALEYSGSVKGVYYTPNPLSLPATNSMTGKAAGDGDVMSRRWLLLDFDPRRATNTPSTEEELEAARIRAAAVRDYLSDKNWPLPIENMSGNGFHLMYRIDIPAEDKLVPQVLKQLSKLFSDDSVDVDEKVGNAARIWKLPGTITCKGEDTADRPHRVARVVVMPKELTIVPQEALAELVGNGSAVKAHTSDFDLADFVNRHLPEAVPKERSYSRLFYSIPTCPFNSEHDRGEAFVQQFPSGAVFAGCLHNSCKWGWRDLWEKCEPNSPRPRAGGAAGSSVRTGLTDLGNAEALIDQYGDEVRYDAARSSPQRAVWLCWNGKFWETDLAGGMARRAKATVLSFYDKLSGIEARTERTALLKHANSSEARGRIEAMVKLAETDPRIQIAPTALDADPLLLNCANGTLDLSTGKLRPHARGDYITKCTGVRFDPAAECPKWERYLSDVTRGDSDLIRYLQMWAGYCLTGLTDEDKLLILHGKGRNGKGCFVMGLHSILGDYAAVAAFATFVAQRGAVDEKRHGLPQLRGARLVTVEEGEACHYLAEGLVKELTGGGKVRCRELYQNFMSFKPQFKLIFATNAVPQITTQSVAMKERLRAAPFVAQYGGEGATAKCDRRVRDEIEAGLEAEGILAWAVRGFHEWRKKEGGLDDSPKAVKEATRELFFEHDKIGLWLEANCVIAAEHSSMLTELWNDYKKFCSEAGIERDHRHRKGLSSDLFSRGGIRKFRNERGVGFSGIGLKRFI